jgi:hypothetical protein
MKIWINELVDKDGVRLGGNNVKLSVDNSVSASNSTIDPMYNPKSGNQLKNATAQQRQQGYRKFPYSLVPLPARSAGNTVDTDYMSDGEIPNKKIGDKVKYNNQDWEIINILPTQYRLKNLKGLPSTSVLISSIDSMDTKKSLGEASKQKMEEYVEDIVSKNFSKDVLSNVKSSDDIRMNGVPDVEVISQENPVLVRKVKTLIDIIEKNQATGEQKGMILNYLINNIGTTDIPSEYKQEMMKKLR